MTLTDLPLRCQCGSLRGTARGVAPKTGKRVVCLCADCQTYARWLAQPGIMDAHGGTDIYQITPSQLAITSGIEHLIGGLPPHAHPKAPLGLMLGITRFLAGAWLSGKARPTPLFDPKTHAPVVEPHVLTHAERDELRQGSASA